MGAAALSRMALMRCPALLISAPASGQGKTTVVAALARLLTRQGIRVRVFKCGPDFLDPHWHQLASGAPVHQLDLWMTGEADIRARLHAAAQECDVVLIEGVMGLFDGTPSAADLAQRLDLPVMAVVSAAAMAGTFGALAYGLQHYQRGLRWAGVLANRVATERHADMLQHSLREPEHWLGALMRVSVNEAVASAKADLLPERHLGLISAQELPDGLERLDAAADALAQTPLDSSRWPTGRRAGRWNLLRRLPTWPLSQRYCKGAPWRWRVMQRSALFTPPTLTACTTWARRWCFFRRWRMRRCRRATHSGCPAATPNCTPRDWPPIRRCAPACKRISTLANPSGRSAAVCWRCANPSRWWMANASRCGACCPATPCSSAVWPD